MTNAQHDTDKMREEFEAQHVDFDFTRNGDWYLNPYVNQYWMEWEACAVYLSSQSAATIARLEEEKAGFTYDLMLSQENEQHFVQRAAAAEADNARLREALKPFANCAEQIDVAEDDEEWAKFRLTVKEYREAAIAFANPLSTSALNAHVAKVTAELQAKVDVLELDAKRYRWLRNMLAIEDVERLQQEFFGSPDEEESMKTDKAVDAAMLEAAPDNQKG